MLLPHRHCERSEAIQSASVEIAMTASVLTFVPKWYGREEFLHHAVDQLFTDTLQQPFTNACDRCVKTAAFAGVCCACNLD
jgi:hypothetical protein